MKSAMVIAIILGLLFPRISWSQHAGYKLYTVADGLVQSEVTALHQDKKGFIWIGTKNGISRFDGHLFPTIRDTAGVTESWVYYIGSLNDSTVWFLTNRGCVIYTYRAVKASVKSFKVGGDYAGYYSRDSKGFFVTYSHEYWCGATKSSFAGEGSAEIRQLPESGHDHELVSVWPNPTTGEITLEIEPRQRISPVMIRCYDQIGTLVLKEEFSRNRHEMNLENQLPGIYFLHVQMTEGSKVVKVIKC